MPLLPPSSDARLESAGPPSVSAAHRPLWTPAGRLLLVGVVLLSAVYAGWHLDRGWIPHDEGALAQSATRVLQGELPHRDFIEIYTGGLAYLNAAAFRLLGARLWTLRIVLFAVFLAWVPAVFFIASRFVRPLAAAAVTMLAVAWTLPTYPEPMPSWYNLFLATIGAAAIFQYLERTQARWLIIAGVAAGLSCLVKITGLYFVAAVLLFLVFRAQETVGDERDSEPPNRAPAYAIFVSAALAVFVAALVSLVRHQLLLSTVVQFVVPGATISALLARNEWMRKGAGSGARFRSLVALALPFLAGIALPTAVFLVPYLRAGAVGVLLNGVFVLPTKRFAFAVAPAMSVAWMLTLVPAAALIAMAMFAPPRFRRLETLVLAVGLPAFLLLTGANDLAHQIVWRAAFSLMPVLVVGGVLVLAHSRAADREVPLLRQRAMLLFCVAALGGIIQFPFSIPIYFCYIAPLVVLAALALYRYLPPRTSRTPAAMLAFFIAFALLRTNTSEIIAFDHGYRPYRPVAPLRLAHGGLEVEATDALVYDRLIAQLRAHERGQYTWAAPDAAEIYFLSDLRNPTPSLFEFFEDSTGRDARVLATLDAHGVTAVALNAQPAFSAGITHEMYVQLVTRFPHGQNIGPFQLRWRQ